MESKQETATEDWQDITGEFFECLKDLELGELTRGKSCVPLFDYPMDPKTLPAPHPRRTWPIRGNDSAGDDGPQDGRWHAVQ